MKSNPHGLWNQLSFGNQRSGSSPSQNQAVSDTINACSSFLGEHLHTSSQHSDVHGTYRTQTTNENVWPLQEGSPRKYGIQVDPLVIMSSFSSCVTLWYRSARLNIPNRKGVHLLYRTLMATWREAYLHLHAKTRKYHPHEMRLQTFSNFSSGNSHSMAPLMRLPAIRHDWAMLQRSPSANSFSLTTAQQRPSRATRRGRPGYTKLHEGHCRAAISRCSEDSPLMTLCSSFDN